MRPLRILTWHVHGSYLACLVRGRHQWYLPVTPGRPHGYGGRVGPFDWPPNVHEVPAAAVRHLPLDAIVFQARRRWLDDQHELLSAAQRRLPRIYLEHDPPRAHPTDTRHPTDDPDVLLVHVTPFNALMWDCPGIATAVIEHGVRVPPTVRATGELARGVVVINHLAQRGRRLGRDVFEEARRHVPLDLIGMDAEALGGLGEVPHDRLPAVLARYRFLFNPIRHTSLGLAVCEAMALGLPVVGLATTEMATVIENGVSGWVDTRLDRLVARMRALLDDPALARRLGAGARRVAATRFGLARFFADWGAALARVTCGAAEASGPGTPTGPGAPGGGAADPVPAGPA